MEIKLTYKWLRNRTTNHYIGLKTQLSNPVLQAALLYWLALGIAFQIGFALWPIGNYSTLTYLGFYIPVIIILAIKNSNVRCLLARADRWLLVSLALFFGWVSTSSLWATTPDNQTENFFYTTRLCLLISLYVLGVAYITYSKPALVKISIYLAMGLAIVLAISSITEFIQLALIDKKLVIRSTFRLATLNVAGAQTNINPVISGIYFGACAIMCAKAIRPAIAPPNRLTGHIITASCVLAALTFVATTTLTGTRTAILGLVIASCFAQWASGRHLSLTLIVAIGFWVLAVALFDETNVLNKLLNRGGFGSLRPQIWHESLTKSVDSWFAGAGMWSDSTINISKADGSLSKQPHAHSAYLQLFHWTGAIGILSYASIYARSSFLCFGSRHTILGGTSLLLLCYFASVQMFDVYSVISKPNQYWVCVWLPIGIILGITATHTYPANSTEN